MRSAKVVDSSESGCWWLVSAKAILKCGIIHGSFHSLELQCCGNWNSRRMAPEFGRVKSHVSCSSTIFWDLVIGVAQACEITITIGLPNSRDSLVECSPGAGLRFLNPLILGLAHF